MKSEEKNNSKQKPLGWLAPAIMRRRTFSAALVACLLAMVYWGVIASDRYVSEAHVIVQRTDLAGGQSVDFTSLLGNLGENSFDQQVLQDYLLSVDMLKKLDAALSLRSHYSDKNHDFLSRFWFENGPMEKFYEYFLSRVDVDIQGSSGIVLIRAQGYDPQTANSIASLMVTEGERYINDMAHRLALEQVKFLEEEVGRLNDRATRARRKVLDYQNRYGLVSPQNTVASIAGIIGTLEARYVEAQTELTVLQGFLMSDSPKIAELNLQINALEKQISHEKDRLTSGAGDALNERVEGYQRLQVEAEYAQQIYTTALTALEMGRIDAARTLKKVSIIQQPSVPEYSLEPRRLYNCVVFILVSLMVAGIVHMLAAIVRDHRD